MNEYEILAAAIVAFIVLALVVCVPALIVGARSEDFDRHVNDDLKMLAADKRNARLNANANGTGWY